MRTVDIIAKKRDGGELTKEEIEFFIQSYTRGDIPDYQAAAWAMAVYLRGMSRRETIDLTLAMAHSGAMLDLHQAVPFVLDKHSTGGVGDKTTIVVAPLVASCGLPVGKVSGRGLGFTGGTLDKLEAIRGYRVPLSIDEFLTQLRDHGIVVAGQTADLAPADGKLYALRDVTATVSSPPLIASSVMSKKIASGADAIVLDVKVGKGSFMQTVEDAVALARSMVEIEQGVGRQARAVISDMNQPLGRTVGNALEVAEAVEALRGRGSADFVEHCLIVAEQMLILGGKAGDTATARRILTDELESGRAWDKFVEWITAQGGDPTVLADPPNLPSARLIEDVPAPRSGYIAGLDARQVGLTAVLLGAGRAKKGDSVDLAVGIVLAAKIGDHVEQGETLLTIHANDERRLAEARQRLLAAYTWSDTPVEEPPLVYRIIAP
jgi:pyrimidine-nucleoside phosphorylase